MDQLKSKWWYEKSECTSDEPEDEDPSKNSLNLINVAGVFYILIVGLILSVFAVILELMYSSHVDAKKQNVNHSFYFLSYNFFNNYFNELDSFL